DRNRARQARDEIPAADLHLQLTLEGQRRADLDLDLFGRALADHQVVLLADVGGDRLVELVAANAERGRHHDATERNHGDLARAAADIDDHVAGRPADGDVGADGSGERLLDQVGRASAGLEGGIANRALL